ncbi:FAS-associated factor 2-like [Dendronephthya gigantea]|uniref:FAS-associated factor 2-like n=1 Tax=Dendronephthya gigantea TaxID=151771 RepID=UPI00106A1CC4|nr:FAS-associated factor 2-like [Dendronephthya gigantea]
MAADDESDNELTSEEERLVLEFQAITGKEDFEECKQLLAQHRWDLQIAVQDALNLAEGRVDVYQDEQRDASTDSDVELIEDEPPGPIREPEPMGLSNWILSLVAFPFTFTLSVITDLYRYIVDLVGRSIFGADTTPLEDVLKFKEEFETKYGRIHPTFYQGSYSQAIEDAKRELRFLLVYLHSSEHKDTEQFCRTTLTNQAFQDYINGNMLFWAADVQSREGYRVSWALRETTYPFMALVCLRDNRMMVVGRLQGAMDVDSCMARLAQLINDNEAALVAARAERAERSFNQTLRAEQDAAYLESLRADQEKDRRKNIEAETKRLEEERKRDKEESIQNKIKEIARKREEVSSSLPIEPESNHPDAVGIVVRLPHGERMDRRFLKTDSLQSLYDYVFCNEQCPHKFKLVSHFPRKVFELAENSDATLDDVGLSTSATLYVHDLTEENSSEED